MAVDYSIFYKRKYSNFDEMRNDNSWSHFISAYNNSERVLKIFDSALAHNKHWLIFPEYMYSKSEYPHNGKFYTFNSNESESEMILKYFDDIGKNGFDNDNLCIDITGFMRPQLIYLIRYLYEVGLNRFDVIYTDPINYIKKENTTFTKDYVYQVKQIQGCEGIHNPDTSNDVLVIGSGYDNKLISSVADDKEHAKKIQIFGFPSLQPDMYQENIIRAYKAEESIGGKKFLEEGSSYFASANDPFMTAKVLQHCINKENKFKPITNLYLSPLSTKVQTLGFVLYYVMERIDTECSIIFPFCNQYNRETSLGISKIWKYTIEFVRE